MTKARKQSPPQAAVTWTHPPPPIEAQHIHIIFPTPGTVLHLLIVGCETMGTLIHWKSDPTLKGGGQTIPHFEPYEHCHGCSVLHQAPRWHGYLAAWLPCKERHVIADISVHAVRTCPELAPGSGAVLRGRALRLRRIGKSSNSPVHAELGTLPFLAEQIPASFDPRPTLRRLWGLRDDSAPTLANGELIH